MRLLLVRHGESTWNVEGRYQGRKDPPLTERGEAQAEAVTHRLRSEKPAALVSSPLIRACLTAKIIASASPALAVRAEPLLIEIQHGEWEGKLVGDVSATWPELFQLWRSHPEQVRFPGGESIADVRGRWREFLAKSADGPSPLIAVTHDIIIRIAVLEARGEPLESIINISVDNGSLTILQDNAVERVNETDHLGALKGSLAHQAL